MCEQIRMADGKCVEATIKIYKKMQRSFTERHLDVCHRKA